jgi:hypothetical protein
MSNGEPKKSNTLVIVLVIVGGVLFLGVAVVGILASMGIYGARRYVSQAKASEGRASVMQLAHGIVSCSAKDAVEKGTHNVPDSAPPVPGALSDVSGKKYQSDARDWSHATYTCASFSMIMPQYFQYEWQKLSPTNGKAIARADLDGDGKAEQVFEVEVSCTSTGCNAGGIVSP